MTKMNCKACNQEIDYVKERQPRAFNFGTEVKHICEGFGQFKPKKSFTSGKAMPIEGELELLAKISEGQAAIEQLKQEVARHDEAIRALVKEVSFKKGTEVSEQ